ncbi:MAG: M1 family metallopeptidase [Flavobacteriales bacterium]|nr:M1 family metallopeptidase [Flavobacteriales bacterium]
MKLIVLGIFLIPAFTGISQKDYWQQHVEYNMNIDMDVNTNRFNGEQELIYKNNSPDTLTKVFYHLYYNAFQPGSMMDARSRTIKDPDHRVEDHIFHLNEEEQGYQKVNSLTCNGKEVKYKIEGTILEVILDKPILPGKKATFNMNFEAQVPKQIRRTGRDNHEGIRYSMTQWYPKMAEYDKDGWHSNPYIGREFHGVWGDFDVKITIDKNYMLGGTGYIQNPQEVGYGYQDSSKALKIHKGPKLMWHFKAPQVHDFAWAADPDFTHETAKLDNGTVLHFIYQVDSTEENWIKLRQYAVNSFDYVNENFGIYPYKQYSIIQGGDGGMEYPMCTLITGEGSFGGLVSVTVHESIHSWYQGLLATNESKHEWMDEGFCTFAQYKTMDHLFDRKAMNPLARQYAGYMRLAKSDHAEPLTTHADFYKLNAVYGTNAYSKGSVLVQQLGYIIGDDNLMEGMKRYYHEWRYKHPTPQDFKRVMEKVSGIELDWYFEQFVETINTIDYGIKDVVGIDGQTSIVLERIGDMPMPIDVVVTFKDGSKKWYNIPMRIMRGAKGKDMYGIERIDKKPWPWVYPEYKLLLNVPMDIVVEIEIDPSTRLADIERGNNVYPDLTDQHPVLFEGK